MPKTSESGATYYGHEGLVEDGQGKVSELDPSRNADGSVVEGFESDERELDDRDAGEAATEVQPVDAPKEDLDAPDHKLARDESAGERSPGDVDSDNDDKEDPPSAGSSSSPFSNTRGSSPRKSTGNRR